MPWKHHEKPEDDGPSHYSFLGGIGGIGIEVHVSLPQTEKEVDGLNAFRKRTIKEREIFLALQKQMQSQKDFPLAKFFGNEASYWLKYERAANIVTKWFNRNPGEEDPFSRASKELSPMIDHVFRFVNTGIYHG